MGLTKRFTGLQGPQSPLAPEQGTGPDTVHRSAPRLDLKREYEL